MKLLKNFLILFVIVFILIGCAEKQLENAKVEQPNSEGTVQTPEETPKESPEEVVEEKEVQKPVITNPLNVPRVNTAAHITLMEDGKIVEEEDMPSLCYLGAFAMLVLFDNPSLDIADVIAYSGIGSNAENDPRVGLFNGYKEKSIITAAQNLGYEYALGVLTGGKANSFIANFKSSASETKYFKDEEEAFNYLKQVIDSGKPVEVHLNTYYVTDDFRKVSKSWVTDWEKGQFSHFMAVTGYDNNYVYINDPTDPNLNVKNMKTSKINFLKAWENGDKTMGAQLGPYWMLYLKDKKKGKTVKEIIAWNKETSKDAANAIRNANSADMLGELAVGRKEFAKFLEKNGYEGAAKLYQEAADIYITEPEDFEIVKETAEKEEQARGLL